MIKRKWFLYLTEFFAGMSVMAVEIGASRLLAPYFSSSQIVWTIIIGTIMIAMALGNVWGGRSADKNPDPTRLYTRLLVAAVWIGLIPLLGKYVIALVAMVMALIVTENYLIWSAFAACMLLFVFPLMLLGTTTPSLVRYTMQNIDGAGAIVGRMNALNTIGSIIGTFAPTFLTIPSVGTAWTFIIFSGVLLLISLLYFLSAKKKRIKCLICIVLVAISGIVSSLSGFAFWTSGLVYEGESIYNYLQVSEDDQAVYLSTNVMIGVQSVMQKDGKLTGMYYDFALAAPCMTDTVAKEGKAPEMLILGLGSGTYASQVLRYFEGATVEGVEIDQRIVDLAYDYFNMPREVKVHVEDGRAVLNRLEGTYDVIMVDAYQDVTIPFQMSSVEFFTLVREHLKPGGVMVVNLNMQSDREGSINHYLCDTIASVFDYVYDVECYEGGNREVFATDNPDALTNLVTVIPTLTAPELSGMMRYTASLLTPLAGGDLILTDDKAPVELLGMRVVDELILDTIGEYRKIFEEEGLMGLFRSLTGT